MRKEQQCKKSYFIEVHFDKLNEQISTSSMNNLTIQQYNNSTIQQFS